MSILRSISVRHYLTRPGAMLAVLIVCVWMNQARQLWHLWYWSDTSLVAEIWVANRDYSISTRIRDTSLDCPFYPTVRNQEFSFRLTLTHRSGYRLIIHEWERKCSTCQWAELVSWYSETCQPQRITSGLKQNSIWHLFTMHTSHQTTNSPKNTK